MSTFAHLLLQEHGEVRIGSATENAGFDVSVTPEVIGSLCRGAVRAMPMLRRVGIKRVWAGRRPGTPDELPVLGPADGVSGYLNATGAFAPALSLRL